MIHSSGQATFRLGLIGCGLNMRQTHAPRLVRSPGTIVAGVCDPDPDSRARLKGLDPSLAKASEFSDHRELLEQVPLDAVVVSTPHAHHFTQIRDALDRGLHVLTEKPLVTRSDLARELIRLRDEHRRVLALAYQRHFEAPYRQLRSMVAEGRLGRLNLIVGHQSEDWLAANRSGWRTDPEMSGGGVVADVMSHLLEAVLWITGLRPVEVAAQLENCGTPVEVVAQASIRFEGGAIAALSTSGNTPRPCFAEELSLWGEAGSVRLDFEASSGAVVTEWLPQRRQVPASQWPGSQSDADANFIRAIRGEEPVGVDAEWGLKVALLKEAIWEAGRSGRVVPVAPE